MPWSKFSRSNLWSNKALAIQLWLHSGHETLGNESPKELISPTVLVDLSHSTVYHIQFQTWRVFTNVCASKWVLQGCVFGPIYVILGFCKNLKLIDFFKWFFTSQRTVTDLEGSCKKSVWTQGLKWLKHQTASMRVKRQHSLSRNLQPVKWQELIKKKCYFLLTLGSSLQLHMNIAFLKKGFLLVYKALNGKAPPDL